MSEQLAKLQDGNRRYLAQPSAKDFAKARAETLEGQKPYAIVLTCSDSRVPPEHIFDAGIGEIFVVRTAGNVVDKIALGSIEYAAEHLHAPLLLVMGHERCGAVKAAWEAVSVSGPESPAPEPGVERSVQQTVVSRRLETQNPEPGTAPAAEGEHKHADNISHVLRKLEKAVKKAKKKNRSVEDATDENVKVQIREILRKSQVCKKLIEEGKLKIVGARYKLADGKVEIIA